MKPLKRLCLVLIGGILLASNAHAGRWITRDPMEVQEHMERDPHPFLDLNPYTFVGSNPMNYVDPTGQWGVAVTGGATGNIGAVAAGGGITGAVGGGVFWGGPSGVNTGVFASGGMFTRESPGVVSLKLPDYDQSPWALGAYAGVGAGALLTNAKKACELKGPFKQWNLNTPVVSLNYANSDGFWNFTKGTWTLSITIGRGAVGDISAYPTATATYPTH